ncbi:MAG TPA: ATP F0F1 synthase subunit B [Devosiaceae bacterium]|nr:ATP F0F1 synthase subunit B [Devosiaceae bacterium]
MAGQTTDIMLVAQAATPAPATSAASGAAAAAGEAASTAAQAGAAAGAAELHATQGAVEAPVGFPPFDTATFGSQILWLVICFGALYWIISRVAIPRIGGIVTKRKETIDGDLAEADRLRKETDRALADYEAALAAARSKAHSIAEETRTKAKAELDRKKASVETDLAGKVSAAEASIQKAKESALTHVDEIAADTTVELVSRLTGTVSPDEARAAVASLVKG